MSVGRRWVSWRVWGVGLLTCLWGLASALSPAIRAAGAQPRTVTTFFPVADGTIVDGGAYGAFDGVPDVADWEFANTGYQGAITLTTESPASSMDSRVVWEYNLTSLPAWWQAARTPTRSPSWRLTTARNTNGPRPIGESKDQVGRLTVLALN